MKRIVFLAFLFLAIAPAYCAITIDSQTISGMSGASSPKQWNMTCSADYVLVDCAGVNSLVTGVTIGGASAALVNSHANGTNYAYSYGLAGTFSGSKQISVSFSAGNDSNMNCTARSFLGVDQASSINVATGTYSNGNQYITISRNTTVANTMIADFLYRTTNNSSTPDGTQTLQTSFPNSTQGVYSQSSYKEAASAGSQSMQWDVGWAGAILTWVALKPAAPAGPGGMPVGSGWFR